MSEPVLSAEGISVRFGGVTAVDDVTLVADEGEIVGIIGPNGAGKTTLMNAISGFVDAEGRVTLDGVDLTRMLPYKRARAGLGRSFQDARLYPTMTVRETLVCAFHPFMRNGLAAEGIGLPDVGREEGEIAAAAEDLLDLVDLRRYLDHRIAELSFGTTRAVELAWLAARRPRILLLDEPASGLQQSEVRVLGSLIERIRHDAAVVVIDHDVPFVAGLAHRLVALDLGEKVADGAADDVLAHPRVIEAYLGKGQYAGVTS